LRGPRSSCSCSQHRIVNNSTFESDMRVPAPLNLPFGQLFFGFKVVPYAPATTTQSTDPAVRRRAFHSYDWCRSNLQPTVFTGGGNTLTSKGPATRLSSSNNQEKTQPSDEAKWGAGGHKLGGPVTYGAGGARAPQIPRRQNNKSVPDRERSPTPDFGVDDDEIIDVDSD
jgi:ubiquitin fusion degradation protein 1